MKKFIFPAAVILFYLLCPFSSVGTAVAILYSLYCAFSIGKTALAMVRERNQQIAVPEWVNQRGAAFTEADVDQFITALHDDQYFADAVSRLQ